MDRFNFLQTGGFPLEVDTLDAMQKAYDVFNALGEISGNKTILAGCVQEGQYVSDGVVYLNGEVFRFKGGNIQTHVRVLQTPTSKAFENGDYKEIYNERYVGFSSGTDEILWTHFKRTVSIAEIQKAMVPIGGGILWPFPIETIPRGWHICDGTNGTTDLRGFFPVCYDPRDPDYNVVGKTGGAKNVTLTIAQMPRHSHSGNVISASPDWRGGGSNSFPNATSTPGNTSEQGGGQPHENRPPFKAIPYIQFIGY